MGIIKLPIVDFSEENLKVGSSSWLSTCEIVRQAFEKYGCFVAHYHKFSLQLHKAALQAVEELFKLPIETKMKNISHKPYYGYTGSYQSPIPSIMEGMGIDYANTVEGTKSFTNLMWSEGNNFFSENMLLYSKLVSEMEQVVKRMVFESYRVSSKHYDSHVETSTYLLRLMKYKLLETSESNLACDVHTDKSFITILHQNDVSGLEIKTKDGDSWISFQPSPSSFLVLAGDAFLAWSNGRVHSPIHRVIMNESKPRYSIGLFTFNEGLIDIPEELVDDVYPLKFKSFNHFDLLHYFAIHQPQKTESTAITYCGI